MVVKKCLWGLMHNPPKSSISEKLLLSMMKVNLFDKVLIILPIDHHYSSLVAGEGIRRLGLSPFLSLRDLTLKCVSSNHPLILLM